MRIEAASEVTMLLQAWTTGDESAQRKLWPIVFAELKRLARRHMAGERADHTLESGALVNEAYVRLVDLKNARWENRAYFFAMCARVMRHILVDHARAREYQKRGGGARKVSLDDVAVLSVQRSGQVLVLDEALKRLASIHPRKSEVVVMRFFGGLSVEETAEVMKISRLTVIRDWNFARAWLLVEMGGHKLDE
jgi:RNA polymerase sigma-70 factor, ECF subfamily